MPFDVTAGFAVDLFPHTHHVEMVAVLTRRPGTEDSRVQGEEEEEEKAGEAAADAEESLPSVE